MTGRTQSECEVGILQPPYCQVIGRNAAVLLTPEMIDRILYEFRDVSVVDDIGCWVTGEMHRAKNAIAAEANRA